MLSKIEVLTEVVRSIQELYSSDDGSIMAAGREVLGSIQRDHGDGLHDDRCSAFAAKFGIGSLLFTACHMEFLIPDPSSVLLLHKDFLHSFEQVQDYFFVEDLRTILKGCRIISFPDWASFDGASDLWDRLRTEVIKPLGRRDFEFIFFLGDIVNKHSFEVDEMIDIVSDFSLYGKVTLILRNGEASQVWKVLSGEKNDGHDMNQCIYNMMNIDRLLIYYPDHRIGIFSHEGTQELKGRSLFSSNVNGAARDHFNTGYILGLLLRLKTIHCVAIGLAMAGAALRDEIIPHGKALLNYIRDWIKEDQLQTEL